MKKIVCFHNLYAAGASRAGRLRAAKRRSPSKARQLRAGRCYYAAKRADRAGITNFGAVISYRDGMLREWIFWAAGCQTASIVVYNMINYDIFTAEDGDQYRTTGSAMRCCKRYTRIALPTMLRRWTFPRIQS